MKTTKTNALALEALQVRPINTATTKIAALKGTTVRSVREKAKKLGYIIQQSGDVILGVIDYDGEKVFSAIKYSSGWDCRIDVNFAKQVGLIN
jgi:hypothetical protein